jgi:hypothetical protein
MSMFRSLVLISATIGAASALVINRVRDSRDASADITPAICNSLLQQGLIPQIVPPEKNGIKFNPQVAPCRGFLNHLKCGSNSTEALANVKAGDWGMGCGENAPAGTEYWDMSGAKDFEFSAKIKTKGESGTIITKAFDHGMWRNGNPGGQAKLLFLRGGKVGFDIGWVGFVGGKTKVNDGNWHTVGLRFTKNNNAYEVMVDGAVDAKGLRPVADSPDLKVYARIATGHKVTGDVANGDMAKRFVGDLDEMEFKYIGADEELKAAPFSTVNGKRKSQMM